MERTTKVKFISEEGKRPVELVQMEDEKINPMAKEPSHSDHSAKGHSTFNGTTKGSQKGTSTAGDADDRDDQGVQWATEAVRRFGLSSKWSLRQRTVAMMIEAAGDDHDGWW
ncbi:hypothetical protein C5167_002324 [Papaver somniferum]|uniref:Uncharacterized protein n=1 Tax=Papaver somniferum TaxID=3469 RepID=A0A4Y7L0L0_PAPSO|nr:hypothetical protein C5167_002324 [Papaver somniferum]